MVSRRKKFFIVGRKKLVLGKGILIIIDILGVGRTFPVPELTDVLLIWFVLLMLCVMSYPVLVICSFIYLLVYRPAFIHTNLITGESYHDLANRLLPVMLEMEREVTDLVIIAHQSVLRVLCAYFMENSAEVRTLFPCPSRGPYHLITWKLFEQFFRDLICAVLGYWFY